MRKTARAALAAAGLAVAATAAPNTPVQAHHCSSLLVFTGVGSGNTNQGTANAGAVGCTNDDEALNTNILLPGNVVQVASFAQPATGTVTIDGVDTALTFTQNSTKTRWNSKWVPLPPGSRTVTATVTTTLGLVETVTYTATPEVSL